MSYCPDKDLPPCPLREFSLPTRKAKSLKLESDIVRAVEITEEKNSNVIISYKKNESIHSGFTHFTPEINTDNFEKNVGQYIKMKITLNSGEILEYVTLLTNKM